jgi:NADP-dependent 3-hydroxy acid dehydrogenase YdfG
MAHYFVTGASSGIGAALAEQLTAAGHQVSAVARRQQRLAALSKQLNAFHGYVADVADAASLTDAIRKAKAKSGAIDVAILNAGIYQPQDGTKIDPQTYANHMAINYLGVVNALAGLVPDMVRWRGLPKSAAYAPTKAALISLAESLYFDLVPHGLKIQVICPGFVDSEATAVNDFKMPDLINADSAASAIINGMQGHDFSINFPKSFTRKMGLLRLLPDRLFFRLVGKQTGAF